MLSHTVERVQPGANDWPWQLAYAVYAPEATRPIAWFSRHNDAHTYAALLSLQATDQRVQELLNVLGY